MSKLNTLKNSALVFLFFLFIHTNGFAQTTYTWNGSQDNTWTNPLNWTPSRTTLSASDVIQFNTATTVTVTDVPGQTIRRLLISGNANVTLQAATGSSTLSINGPVAGNNISVAAGSTLGISSGTNTLILTFSTTALQQLDVAGTLLINGNGTLSSAIATCSWNIGGTIEVNPGGTFNATNTNTTISGTLRQNGGTITATAANTTVASGGTYDHAINAGTIPTLSWNANATLLVSGTTNTSPTGFSTQTFGHLNWNAPGQTAALSMAMASGTFNGNFTVSNTGSGSVAIHSGAAATVAINGDLIINNGTLNLNNAGASITTLNIAGNLVQNNGTFQRGASTGVQAINFTNAAINRNINFAGGTFISTGIAFTVNLNAIVTLASDVVSNQSFTVNGTLHTGTRTITGTGTFAMAAASTATLSVGDPAGLTPTGNTTAGNIRVGGTKTYSLQANYIYNGVAAQVSGTGLPATYGTTNSRITIDNPAGVTLSQALTFNNSAGSGITLQNGILNLDAFNLTLPSNTDLSGSFSVSAMVVTPGAGQLIRGFPAAPATFTYPVGDITGTTEYSPITLNFSVLGTATNIGIRVIDADHPAGLSTDYLSRYWSLTASAIPATYTLFTTATYVPADVVGTQANIRFNQFNTATQAWTEYPTSLFPPNLSSNLTQANALLIASFDITGRADAPLFYRSVANGNWNDAATWEVAAEPTFASPVPAVVAPTASNSVGIEVRAAHTVTITANVVADDLFVNGTLNLNSGVTLTIANGAAAIDAEINGIFINDGIFTITAPAVVHVNGNINNSANSGAYTSTAATLFFNAGSFFNHQRNGGTIPTATWNVTSTLNITGITNTVPTGINQTFGNFTWNCAAQSAPIALGGQPTIVNGNYTVSSTNNFNLNMAAAAYLLAIGGDLNVSGLSVLNLNTTASVTTISLTGNFNQTGGTITATGVAAHSLLFAGTLPNRTYTHSGGTFNANNINRTVNSGAFLTLNDDIDVPTGRTFTNSGTLITGSHIIAGAGTFTNTSAATATLSVNHPDGINLVASGNIGSIRTGVRNFGAAANYIFNSACTATGTGFTAGTSATFNGCAISMTSQVTLSGNAGALVLNNALLRLGNNNLTLSSTTSTITGAAFSNTNMVVTNGAGLLIRAFATGASSFTFPVGDETSGADYAPVTYNFIANNTARNIGVRTVNSTHPNDVPLPADYINRHWPSTSSSIAGTYTLDITFEYPTSDIVGTEANLKVNRFITTTNAFTEFASSVGLNQVSATVNNASAFIQTAFDATLRNDQGFFYRTTGDGLWTDLSIWEVSTDPTFTSPAPVAAIASPTVDNSNGVTISSGHNVTVAANLSIDDLFVDGTLTVNPGITLTINNGVAPVDAVINGTLAMNGLLTLTAASRTEVNGNYTVSNTTGTVTSAATTLFFNAGSNYNHARNGGAVPLAFWAPTSTANFTGITNTVVTAAGLNQDFGNIIWNNAGQTVTQVLFSATPRIVKGNLTISATNGSVLNLWSGVANTTTINGNFTIDGANTAVNINTGAVTTALNLGGNFLMTNGTLNSTSTALCTWNFTGANATYQHSGGSITTTNITRQVIAGATLTFVNTPSVVVATSRAFNVLANGTLMCGTTVISGAGIFSVLANGTLGVGSPDGLTANPTAAGNIQTTTRTYTAGANYIYNAAAAQVIGAGLTTNPNNLTINNASGVTLSANLTIGGILTLQSGVLSLGSGAFNLNLTNTASNAIQGSFSTSNMIVTPGTGSIVKSFAAGPSAFTYPVGDQTGVTDYTPLTLTFISNAAAGTVSLRLVDDVHPNNGAAADFISRYFIFGVASLTNYTYTLSADFVNNATDVNGDLANIGFSRWNGTTWTPFPLTISGNTLSIIGTLNQTTAPLAATSHFAGRTQNLLYYRSISSGNWTNVNTWETSPVADFSTGVQNPAAAAPTSANALAITIRNGDVVNINSAVTSAPLFVDGTLEMQTGGSFTTLISAQFNASGIYIHNQNAGTVPAAVWHPSSECRITGTTAAAPVGIVGQTFGRFTYNATGQTSASLSFGLTTTTTTFNGDFTVESTGTPATNTISLAGAAATVNMNAKLIINGGTLQMNTAAAATTLTVAGDLEINGGTFNLTTSTSAQVLNVGGNYVHAGGTLNNTGAGLSTITFTGANRTYNQSGGTVTNTNINYAVSATGALTINSAFTLSTSRNFTIAIGGTLILGNDIVVNGAFINNGTLVCGTRLMTGAGTFTLANAATATLSVGDPGGLTPTGNTISGNVRVSGTKTYNSSANIVYNGTVAQATGTGLAATWGTVAGATRIVINNPAGVTLSQGLTFGNVAGGNGIDLVNGHLLLGNNNIIFQNAASTITGSFDNTTMLVTNGTGVFQRNLPTGAGNYLYPIGDITGSADYSPVNLSFSTLGTATNIGIRVVDARDPNDQVSTDYLTRHWVISSSAAPASYAVDATFSYVTDDVVGAEANIKLNRFNPAAASLFWNEFVSNAASNMLTANLTNASGYLLATTFSTTGRVNEDLYYRSVSTTGTWSNLASWEVSTDPNFVSPAPVTASVVPNNLNSAGIFIQVGHTMNVTTAQTADDVIVEGILSVNGVAFTLANGPAAFDMVVNGTLRNNGVGSIITPTGAIQINGTYEHAMNAGTVPAATWTNGSTCLISGITVNQPGGLNQSFHHFTWNCPSQGNAVSMLLTGTNNWGGDFRVLNTGSPTARELRLTAVASTLNLAGSLLIDGGIFVTQNGTTVTNILNISGDLLVSGTGNLAGISTSGGLTTINLSGDFQVAATASLTSIVSNTTTAVTVNMLGANKQLGSASGFPAQGYSFSVDNAAASITLTSDVVVGSNRTFNVNTGTLIMGTRRISGNGSFTLASTNAATLSTSDPDGLVVAIASPIGAIRTTTVRNFGALANYVFTGSNQVIGTPIATPPFVCNSLTINSPNTVTLTQNVNVTANLNLLGGILELDNFNLGLLNTNNTTAITGNTPSATNMVSTSGTGRLFKSFATGGPQAPFTYPLGDRVGTNEYSPMTLTLLTNAVAGTVGASVKDEEHPNNAGAVDYLSRYWSFATTGLTNYTYSANFSYLPADIEGDINNIAGARWNGSTWSSIEATTTSNTLTLTANPLSNITAPLNGNDFTGRTSQFVYFFRTMQSGNWHEVNTWQIATDAAFTTPVWPAPFAPTAANSESVLIRSGHVVTVTNNVSIDQLAMDNSATSTLTINPGVIFTLLDGPGVDFAFGGGSARVNINGTFINQGTQSGTPPAIFVGPSGIYEHAQNGGAVYTATWDAASTCLITGVTTTTPTGISGQTFGNFTWNTPGMTMATTTAIIAAATTFNGDFTLVSTGSPATNTLLLSSGGAVNFNGNLNIQNGTLNQIAAAVALTINLSGNYNQTGGVYTQTSNTVSTFNFTGTNPLRSYTQSGASSVVGTSINRTIAAGAFLTLNNDIDVASARSFINNGTLIMGQRLITGAGSFTNAANATLSIGHPDGIVAQADPVGGNVQTNTRVFNSANYIYTATALHTGTGLPATIVSLTFDGCTINLTNATTANSALNALSLNNALVSLGNNNLTLSSATSNIAGAFGNNNMIITNGNGQLIRQIPTSAFANPYIFPIGGANGYSPAMISFTASAGGNLGARVTEGTHPNMFTPPVADYLNRFWNFTTSMASYTYSGLLQYQNVDVVGNENLLLNSQFDGVSWNGIPSIVDAGDNTLYFPGAGTLTHTAAPLTAAFTYTARNTQVPYHYRTVASGNWNNAAIWEISTDPAFANPLPVAATTFPDAYNSLSILIRNNHQVAFNADLDIDQLTIDNTANSRLTINAGNTLNLIDGPGNDLTLNTNSRLDVNGTLRNAGQILGSTATTTSFFANSTYEHNQNGGTVPTATWNATSTCLISGTTANTPAGISGQTLGHFTWNTPNMTMTSTTAILAAATTFNGNFRVVSTGTPATNALLLSSAAITTTINGDLIIEGGTLNLASAAVAQTLNLSGNYNQTGGTFTQTGTAVSTLNMNGVNRSYTQSGGNVINTNINYQINAAAAVITLNNGIDIASGRSFTIASGRLNLGTNLITGAGTFTLTSVATATLGIGHPDGIALLADGNIGNIRTTTARSYGALANYVYTATAQNTGSGLTAATTLTFDGCTINLSNNATVSGTTNALSLNSALVSLGNSNLTLNNGAATIAGTFSNTNMLITGGTGQFLRQIPTSGFANPYVFPIGAAGVYSPMSISFASNGTAGLVGGRIINTVHPSIGSAPDYLNRYWRTTSTLGTYTINNFTLGYDDAIVTGNEAELVLSGFTGSAWFGIPTTLNTTANTLTVPVSGTVDQAALPLNNFDYTGRNTLVLFYRTVASGNWSNPAIWETSPNASFTPANPATVAPTADNSVSILIRSGHVVEVTANTDADQLTIDNTANSTLNVNVGVTFTLLDGLGNDLSLAGANARLIINGTLVNNGQITGSTATTTAVNATGFYEHAFAGGTIPTSTWNAGSTCLVSGVVATAPTGLNQNFRNFIWHSPNQTATNLSLAGGLTTVLENFNVENTGTGSIALHNAATTLTVSGDFNLSGGTLNLNFGGAVVTNFNLAGNYNQTGGTLTSTATSPAVINFTGANRTYTQSGGTLINNLINYQINTAGALLTLNSDLDIAAGRSFTVSNGTLNLADRILSGAGTFTATSSANATIQSGSANGLQASAASGNVQTAVRNYGALANYTFNGSAAQNTGNGVTSATTLTFNNATGVTMGGSVSTVNLNLMDGVVTTSTINLITVTNTTGAIAGTPSATACINGPMARILPNSAGAGPWLWPLGKGGSYNPFEILSPSTSGGTVTILAEVFNANSGGTGGPGFAALNTNRYWSASITAGAPNLTNTGTVRLTENTPALVAGVNAIGQSATVNGTYAFKGGSVSAPTISNASALNPGYGFFNIGVIGPITCPAPVLTVGVGESFNNLTDLAAVLNGTPINCNLTVELTNNYTSSNEVWPVAFNQFNYGAGGPFTVTIRPAAGTTALVSGASASQLINFNGADNVIIDGRQGGTGAPHSLIFNNTNTSGSTIQFINDAQNNIVRFADIRGSATATFNGVIVIGTSSSGTGNDNININNNLINGGITRPANLIYAAGTSTRDNDGISILNNQFFNWGLSSTATSSAVSINAHNHSWTISDNSFYLPTVWTTAGNIFGVNISATSAANSNFTVSGNFIGGDAPALGSNAWTVNATGDYRFCGIAMNVNTTGTNTVQNNSISNFSITSGTSFQTQSSAFSGIFAQGGVINISNNTIGSTTQGYDIIITLSGLPLTNIHGIYHDGNLGLNISNNQIIGIQTNGVVNSLYGIRAFTSSISGSIDIANNQIGLLTGNIGLNNNSGTGYSGTGTIFTAGIHVTSARPANITGNLVKDIAFSTNATSTGGGSNRTVGIYRENGTDNVIQNNTVRNITSSSPFAGTGFNAAVAGINANVSTGPGHTISQNTVHSIESLPSTAAATTASGIAVRTPATSVVNQSIFTENFASAANWNLNVVTGAEGASPNPWEIGNLNASSSCPAYPGGTCGAANNRGLYIRCTSFICDLVGGGCPVYNASSSANNSNRAAHLNTNISTVNYTNITMSFAWRCGGSPASYGQVRYSTDGGSTWVDLPTQYRAQTSWQCANISLPAACENIPNLRIGFRWINSNNSGDIDPPMILTNVEIRGDLQSSQVSVTQRNNVHSVVNLSTSASAIANGIHLVEGTNLVYNNMVRMGIRSTGASQTNGTVVNGISVSAGNATIYHNSVYVGGTGVGGSANSFALFSTSTSTVSSLNNILFNARSNGAGSGKHYAHRFSTLSNLTSDYNLLLANGNGAVLGAIGATDYAFLPYWHLITGRDINSVTGNPQFVNATGNAASVDLHIVNGPTPIESAGTPLAAVSIDFDNDDRASNTPADIGADAGLFSPVDLSPPAITFTPIPLQAICQANTTTTLVVNITDNQSGISLSNHLPRLYFRRSVGAPTTPWSNVNAVEGTYLSGTSQNSTWQFVIDYAAFGITPAGGNQFEYYVVAQDQAPTVNIGYSQTNGTSPVHSNTATMVTAPGFAFGPTGTFSFGAIPLSGTVTVGSGGDYATFNGPSGLFQAINTNGLGGDLEVLVISDINEGANWTPLNAHNEFCGSNYTITIRPNAATLYTVEANSSAANAMFSFYGARRVIIDGRFNGDGRFLRLRHNRVTAIYTSTVEYNFGANNNVLRNCIIEGANINNSNNTTGSVGVVRIGGSMGFASGNLNNITIQDNEIRNLSNVTPTLTNVPMNLIYLGGANNSANINTITITGNNLYNFQASAIRADNGSSSTANSIGNNITITYNNIYQPLIIPTYQYPIVIDALAATTGHLIEGNKIGGSAAPNPDITGTWQNNKSDGEIQAIYLNVGNAPSQAEATTIRNNTIANINLSGTGWGNFIGIRVERGRVNVVGNTIGSLASSLTVPNIVCAGNGDGGFGLTGNTMVAGIWTQSTQEVRIDSNIVCGLASTSGFSFMDGIAHGSNLYFNDILYNTPGGKATITNNQVLFNRSSSRLQNLAIPSPEGFMGIFCWTSAANNLIQSNKVRNCGSGTATWNRNVRIHGMFVGVYGSTTAQTGVVNANEISHLFNENSGDNTGTINPIIYGLSIANGNWTVSNNTIYLNNGTQGGTVFTNRNTSLRGLNDGMLFNQANCQARYYNNTVHVSGSNLTGVGPPNSTYAFLRFPLDYGSISITAGAPIELRNNIFINDRGGLGNHRAMGNIANTNANASINWNNTTSDYNFLATPSLTNVALWGASASFTLANWQTLSGGGDPNTTAVITTTGASDATQVNPSELFINIGTGPANLRIIETPPNDPWPYAHVNANGTPLALVPNDIDNDLRDPLSPDIGADEFLLCAQPTITAQPADQLDICPASPASFTATVIGLAPVNLQWQESTDGGLTWNNLSNAGIYSGVNTNTLNISAVSSGMNNNRYRLLADNACGNSQSNEALLTVVPGIQITGYSPVTFINNICSGNTSFGVTATGNGLTYQWQVSEDGGNTWFDLSNLSPYSGSTTATLSISNIPPPNLDGNRYRVIITDACNAQLISAAGVLNVGVSFIVTQPVAQQTVCTGSNVSITVVATGNNNTYQWQLSTDNGVTWNNTGSPVYSGSNTPNLTFTAAQSMNNNLYRVIVNSTCNVPATSDESLLNVEFPGLWLGAGTDWDTPANWGCGILPTNNTDVLIPTNPLMGNVFPEVSSNNISVAKDLTIQTGASVTVQMASNLSLYGNLTNNGLNGMGAGTVRFAGNSLQIIDGTAQTAFGSIELNNSTIIQPALELNQNISVSGTITMQQGRLHLNGSDINLQGTGSIVNESNANRIYGNQGEIKTVLNMAANTAYNDIFGMGVSITTGAVAPGVTVIERGHFQHTHMGSYQSIQRYFDISPSVNNALNATLRIHYFDDELAVAIGPPPLKANLLPWRSTDNGVTWEGQFFPANLTNDIANNWVQLSGIPAFSRWTLSDWINHPLPVQLLSFTATANYQNQQVDLQWITASEINNAFFTVERSKNLTQVEVVLNRAGAGNSNSVLVYNDVDPQPLHGLSYYRLKQTDFDGQFSYSSWVPVMFGVSAQSQLNGLFLEGGQLLLNHISASDGSANLLVMDASGRIVYQGQHAAGKGSNVYQLPSESWAPGVYLIRLIQNGEIISLKTIKTLSR